jgi:hypothetical protein
VFIINLIAGKTREGRVVKILLDKLELIRKELKSEKVYDVIGRVFEGRSITEYMRRSLEGEDMDQLTLDLGGQLTKEQVAAIAERERRLYGDGGDVARQLPALKEKMATEVYSQLLPGYVRQFVLTRRLCCIAACAPNRKPLSASPDATTGARPLLPMLESNSAINSTSLSRPRVAKMGRCGFIPANRCSTNCGTRNLGATPRSSAAPWSLILLDTLLLAARGIRNDLAPG